MSYIKVKNFLLYIVVSLIPFYTWDPIGLEGEISMPGLIAMLYAGYSLIQYRSALNLKDLKPFIFPLLFLLIWMFIVSFANQSLYGSENLFNFTFFQFILLVALFVNHLKGSTIIIYRIMITYCLSVFVLAVLIVLGIGAELVDNRITFFGDNSNNIGIRASIAIVTILGIVFEKDIIIRGKFFLLLCIPQLFLLIGVTASRGALIALVVGLLFLVIFLKDRLYKYILVAIIISLFAVGNFRDHLLPNDELLTRMTMLMDEGDESRAYLYKFLLPATLEHPITGVGENGYLYTSINKFGEYRSPHNWFLYVMLAGGIIGLSAFLLFFYRIFKNSWLLIRNKYSAIPMTLLLIIAFNISKSGNQLTEFTVWFVLSIVIAWGIALNKENPDLVATQQL